MKATDDQTRAANLYVLAGKLLDFNTLEPEQPHALEVARKVAELARLLLTAPRDWHRTTADAFIAAANADEETLKQGRIPFLAMIQKTVGRTS